MLKMNDAELSAAWANMLVCSESTASALATAQVAACGPIVSALLVAMNLSQIELSEIAIELGHRGLHHRKVGEPLIKTLPANVVESMRLFDRVCD